MILKSLKQIFHLKKLDCHWLILIAGIQIKIKTKTPTPQLPALTASGITEQKRDVKIIVSLTSFPQRIPAVIKTIQTLLLQTLKPDEVVLWLAYEQFPGLENDLPKELLNLKNYGLSIKFCNDIRSFKKYVPTLKEHPDDIIITCDDDIYYAENTVETLYNEYLKNPKFIYTHRFSRIKNVKGKVIDLPGKDLYFADFAKESFFNRLTGCGAVLYPPYSLHSDVLREDIFTSLIPTHDDVWLWAMSVLNNTKTRIVKGYSETLTFVEDSQDKGLCKINKKNSAGMPIATAYEKIVEKYPQIISILNKELVEDKYSSLSFIKKCIREIKSPFLWIINSIIKICLELFVFDRKIRRILKGNVAKAYIKKYVKVVSKDKNIDLSPKPDKPYKIWQYWEQGLENLPPIVDACLNSVVEFESDTERTVLTFKDIEDYVEIPGYLYDLKNKGKMKSAHFSDIVRTNLLLEHGGTWVDSTVLLTDNIPQFIKDSELFVFQNDTRFDLDGLNMSNYFMSAKPNNKMLYDMKCFLSEYWQNNNFAMNYFIYMHAFTMLTESSETNKNLWKKVPFVSFVPVQRLQHELLNEFSEERWEQIKAASAIHKLTYKQSILSKDKNLDLSGTFYEKILQIYDNNQAR